MKPKFASFVNEKKKNNEKFREDSLYVVVSKTPFDCFHFASATAMNILSFLPSLFYILTEL